MFIREDAAPSILLLLCLSLHAAKLTSYAREAKRVKKSIWVSWSLPLPTINYDKQLYNYYGKITGLLGWCSYRVPQYPPPSPSI